MTNFLMALLAIVIVLDSVIDAGPKFHIRAASILKLWLAILSLAESLKTLFVCVDYTGHVTHLSSLCFSTMAFYNSGYRLGAPTQRDPGWVK